MPRNVYFSQAVKSEQNLYEDLIIESLKIYGQDVYYIPRTLVNRDNILGEDPASSFDDAYLIEMYFENVEGFEGQGDLYSKFGLEIRDEATFVVSRKMWNQSIGRFETRPDPRPQEGDLIFLPMTNSFFEISYVEDDSPFFQLSNLPTYKMQCRLFEYNDEDFETGLDVIDNKISQSSFQVVVDVSVTGGNHPEVGEVLRQTQVDAVGDTPAIVVFGEVASRDKVSNTVGKLYLQNVGVTGSNNARDFIVSATRPLVGDDSGYSVNITKIYGLADVTGEAFITDGAAENITFEAFESGFMDFSESNPFGEP